MSYLFTPLKFNSGAEMKNRFALAPLTNKQSRENGEASDQEINWLRMRAEGGFGLTMTCAAPVHEVGRGYDGQLGCFHDRHIKGLTQMAAAIKNADSLAIVQLAHSGARAAKEITGMQPVGPIDDPASGARALSTAEVAGVVDDFVGAARRAEKAGFDGIELHGGHGNLLTQFLSTINDQRDDEYGGELANRSRLIFEVVDAIRDACRPDFLIGIRLSAEMYSLDLAEVLIIVQQLMNDARLDFIDMSLWDVSQEPRDGRYAGQSLLALFAGLDRGKVRLGVAGHIRTPEAVRQCIEGGADFVLIGRSAILHADFPLRIQNDPDFKPVETPISAEYLRNEGLTDPFIEYMSSWAGFVAEHED